MHEIFLVVFVAVSLAAPAPDPVAAAALPTITLQSQLDASLSSLYKGPASNFAAGYSSLLSAIRPSATLTDEIQVASALATLATEYRDNPLAAVGGILLRGCAGDSQIGKPANDVTDFGPCNGNSNDNIQKPSRTIYPKQDSSDASYDLSETKLRSAIYFPFTITHGKTRPVLFVPGTGTEACENFAPNIGKLVAGSTLADPVYVNVPGNMLNDEQTNAEYVAYAINYVSAITGNQQVSVVTWSAGGAITQWALKYWPSVRQHVRSFVAISPDFHGTVEAPLICPPGVQCPPAIFQQFYTAKWIATLRAGGGSSALVPTTVIHNVFDEVVEPQADPTASADLPGAANVQIQDFCPVGTLAGGPNPGHENALYNPVAVANVLDALKHGGKADPKRAGPYNCTQLMADGLTLSDVFASEFLIPLAGFNIVADPKKVNGEPPIKTYATH
jgi:pimeloyl-ACP methyl ester carboxylesterase